MLAAGLNAVEEDIAEIKKAPRSAGLLVSGHLLLFLGGLFLRWSFLLCCRHLIHLRSLNFFTTIAHLFRVSFLLETFLSHVTQKFKTKITTATEIFARASSALRDFRFNLAVGLPRIRPFDADSSIMFVL
jgi:hypothetical protein